MRIANRFCKAGSARFVGADSTTSMPGGTCATSSAESSSKTVCAVAPPVDGSLGIRLLPGVLAVTAGSVDVISFLELGGLFTAHVTGNLVILAAHIATGRAAPIAHILSVPVFLAMLLLTRLLAAVLEETRQGLLWPLLTLQLVLLACFMAVRVAAGSGLHPDAPCAVAAGMLGVAAMAVQNALVQITSVGPPATAVMTTDITVFMLDVGTVLLSRDPRRVAFSRSRGRRTWPPIIGFTCGCGLGAIFEAVLGRWSIVLPIGFAMLALALGLSATRRA